MNEMEAQVRNSLQLPYTVLERMIQGKGVEKDLIQKALKNLEIALDTI